MKTQAALAAVAACAFLCMPRAAGSLLIYEGYNGYSAGVLNGQTATNTIGFNAVAISSGGTGNVNSFDATGLTFSNLLVTGGSGRFHSANSGSNAQSYIGYTYNGTAVSGTLYSSHLVRLQAAQTSGSIVAIRANLNSTFGVSSSYFATMADASGSTRGGIQYDADLGITSASGGGETLAIDTTYVVIGRFTNVGTALSPTTTGQGTTFILTQAQFDHFKVDGFTDLELDSASIGSAETQVYSRINDAPVTTSTPTTSGSASAYPSGFNRLVAGNSIQVAIGNAGTGFPQTVNYDEIRYGTSLTDVLPLAGAPNPDAPLISLTVVDAIATEPTAASPSIGRLRIDRLDSSTQQVNVSLLTTGTAKNGRDFYLPSTVTLPAGTNSKIIEIKPAADRIVEPDETVIVTATPGIGYNLGAETGGTVTIRDGPPATRTQWIENLSVGIPHKVVVFGTSLTAGGAWSVQTKAALDTTYPGLTTLVNSGGSGQNSVWAKANLTSKVISQFDPELPGTVFIEFAVNDAYIKSDYATRINPAQARKNLVSIIDTIQAQRPECEIILQVMNPVISSPTNLTAASTRPNLVICQQNYRDVGRERGLLVIDHMPAWQALLDQGNAAFLGYVNDGLHPGVSGYTEFVTPVILRAIGAPNQLAAGTVNLRADNHRAAEPVQASGAARSTRITITRGGDTSADLSVSLNVSGTASNGADYGAIPSVVTIPTGAAAVSFDVLPVSDAEIEGEETWSVSISAAAGYTLASPSAASGVIEDRPFDHWRKNQFTSAELLNAGISGSKSDPDGDGIDNLLEFLTGRSPKTADQNGIATFDTETQNGSRYLSLTYDRIANHALTCVAETSTDLIEWQHGSAFIEETVLSDDGLIRKIKARSLVPMGNGSEFLRLRVVLEP